MSRPDIDEINAALKLGDRFYPPRGAVCEVRYDWRTTAVVVDSNVEMASQRGYRVCTYPWSPKEWVLRSKVLHFWALGDIVSILDFIREVPPFSEWERL